ncbi:alpha-galactosidase [Phytohabitans aurantiacus]|uniref:Alpha-galactosidase n=1 Tax=Phytohabitans aurantiacus TaxID=3016789 RepID=A0ABQ5QQL5_9ACTN|nr:alpha-galactosidase [Phytohabitans aurantiacus]GLH96910.1 alpha-galactosidase [Phytohabitans aurantiacus]
MADDDLRWDALVHPDPAPAGHTVLALAPDPSGGLPLVSWLGVAGGDGASWAATAGAGAGSLLPEQAHGWYVRPGLRGHRLGTATAAGSPPAGLDWSTVFRTTAVTTDGTLLRVSATDEAAGLALATEAESLPGGALRLRHTVTNTGDSPYIVDGLEVVLPLPEHLTEVLDFTGRWARERVPQRHELTDGLYLRENRRGKTGLDAATMIVVGTPGFGFERGEVIGVHVAWSGNNVYRVERSGASPATAGGGELLLPGELILAPGDSYSSPWLHVAASRDGLDGLAAAFHGYQRSLPAHPSGPRPVNLNVWEAVYFDHDLARLRELADIAASIGVERYVLDDGWFRGRRDDKAGLGDWYVDEGVWPDGLGPLIDHVRGLGMAFGLWFEPEMVNPDSDLYRQHPDWILSTGGRTPLLQRNQYVLDLSRPEVVDYLIERIDAVLSTYDISYVKWDHNRDLLEAGSAARGGAPAVHGHTLGFYRLLDELRARHPGVEWESCASGGGRVDIGVLERVQRVWTSDMTDAKSRQAIQRWTVQLAAPEYLGAHIASPESHQTHRVFPLDFRAATALFGHFGIEWDLTSTDVDERAALAEWIDIYKTHRDLLHSGRVVRLDSPDPAVWAHGVIAADGRRALMAHVQMDESESERLPYLRVPGLAPGRYEARWLRPVTRGGAYPGDIDPVGPAGEAAVDAEVLSARGLPMPRRAPNTVTLVSITPA